MAVLNPIFRMMLICFSMAVFSYAVELKPEDQVDGYLARLLINESPFPGERGWVSEKNSQSAMLSILWVLHSRIHHIPDGYNQSHIASTDSRDIIDVITVGGEKGQCDGFYRDEAGHAQAVPRIHERIQYLQEVAGKGAPGKFARLLDYAQGLATAYAEGGMLGADRFAGLTHVGSIAVTGRAYSWMTDMDYYKPGGNFIKIPDEHDGSLGGNRFFTLKKL